MTEEGAEIAELLRIQNAKLEDIIRNGSANFRRYRRRAMIAFVIMGLSIAAALYWQWSTQRQTAHAAKAACLRSQKVGPPFIDGLSRHHVLSPRWIRYYRNSIPKTCPK
jgi:hypothetical protein